LLLQISSARRRRSGELRCCKALIFLAELFEYLDLQALGRVAVPQAKEQSKEEYEAFLAERCINSGAVEAADY